MFQDKGWKHAWIVGTRDVTNVNNERTAIACLLPRVGLLQPLNAVSCINARDALVITGAVNSFVVDSIARQRFTGRHLNVTTFSQLPIPDDQNGPIIALVSSRALELTYISWDLLPFARDCDYDGPPFRWDEKRRFQLRCELDAAFFRLYLGSDDEWFCQPESLTKYFPAPRDAVSYIMDTFPIVKRKDEEKFGTYRTKDTILNIYDALAESHRTGQPYVSPLNPPPGPPTDEHGHFIPVSQWDPNHWPSHIHLPRETDRLAVPVSSQIGRITAFDESRVLRLVTPYRNERYTNCVPRLDLKIAAGDFSDDQLPEFQEWIEINASLPLRKGMFVARVVGRSMEPLIPDGAYCLFQFKAPQLKNGMIGVQLHGAEDPEMGGSFTVKRLNLSTHNDPIEGPERVATLIPENPAHNAIQVTSDNVKFIAEFLEVLQPFNGDETAL